MLNEIKKYQKRKPSFCLVRCYLFSTPPEKHAKEQIKRKENAKHERLPLSERGSIFLNLSPEKRAKRHKGMPARHALISVWRVLIFIQHAPRKVFYPKKNATDEKPYFVQHGFIVLSASPETRANDKYGNAKNEDPYIF